MERLYLDTPLGLGLASPLPPAKAHYLTRVLRLKSGATLGVFDRLGQEWEATLELHGKEAAITPRAFLGLDPEPRLKITLAQALPKQAKLEVIWQKACELGVARLVPLLTSHSQVKLDLAKGERKMERWETVLEEACRQCGRRRLPELLKPLPFDEFLSRPPVSGPIWLAYEGQGVVPLARQLAKVPPMSELTLIIGPEGGFAPQEVAIARGLSVPLVGLGPRILRVETAGPAAIAIVQAALGDWNEEN